MRVNGVAVPDTVQFPERGKAESPVMPPRIEFYTARDGGRLAVRVWRTEELPRARVVILHGITSHGGWYGQVASHLANEGFDVHLLDRRGSGLNAEQPGDVDDWRTWIDDVAMYLDNSLTTAATRSQPRQLPTILCGISWGGKLAPAVARHHAALIDALALICPGMYSPFLPGVAKRIILAAPVPDRMRGRCVRIPLRRPELFTDTPRWREFIAQDPLALRRVTWRFAQEDRRLTRFARESAHFLHLPTLMMLAGQDRIVNNSRARQFFGRVVGAHKTLIEYGGAAHTLEFERDPSEYFADLADWLSRTAATVGH
jgi:alpha-beta hydrolase superfamily lysophospholipase